MIARPRMFLLDENMPRKIERLRLHEQPGPCAIGEWRRRRYPAREPLARLACRSSAPIAPHGFATLRESQGDLQEAVSLYQRALSIREHTHGHLHPKTVNTRKHLCGVLVALGRTEEAAQINTEQPELAATEGKHQSQRDDPFK